GGISLLSQFTWAIMERDTASHPSGTAARRGAVVCARRRGRLHRAVHRGRHGLGACWRRARRPARPPGGPEWVGPGTAPAMARGLSPQVDPPPDYLSDDCRPLASADCHTGHGSIAVVCAVAVGPLVPHHVSRLEVHLHVTCCSRPGNGPSKHQTTPA